MCFYNFKEGKNILLLESQVIVFWEAPNIYFILDYSYFFLIIQFILVL